jgi:hypothetical protein
MNKRYLFSLTILSFLFLLNTSCKPGGGTDPTVLDLLKGTTWKLGTITNKTDNTPANAKFQNFTLTINAAGNGGSVSYTGDVDTGSGPQTATVTVNIDNTAKKMSISGFSSPGLAAIWTNASTAFNVQVNNNSLIFTINLVSPKTGSKSYEFNLVKQ